MKTTTTTKNKKAPHWRKICVHPAPDPSLSLLNELEESRGTIAMQARQLADARAIIRRLTTI